MKRHPDPDIRLVAVDMDGTLLRPDHTYDRTRFARVRTALRERGVRYVVASGNQHAQLRSFFENPDEFGYVSDNGAYVLDGSEALFTARTTPAVIERVLDVLDAESGLSYLGSAPGRAYVPARVDEAFYRRIARYYPSLERIDSLHEVADRLFKFVLAGDQAVQDGLVERLRDALGPGVVPVPIHGTGVDINLRGITKATGLAHLLDRWGIPAAQVAAFGDGANDLELLGSVGHSVAMANAIPEVKAAARYHAPANTEDGVLAQLEEWFT